MNFEFYTETNFRETELGLLPEDWRFVDLIFEFRIANYDLSIKD